MHASLCGDDPETHKDEDGHDHRDEGPGADESRLTSAGQADERGSAPAGVEFCVPDDEQIRARGAGLTIALASMALPGGWWLPPALHPSPGLTCPHGSHAEGALHLRASRAGERLVRTSLALLI